ncbi:MAG TPA: hypothetical protein VF796_09500 [Humisphaera sp.]
MIRSPLAQRLAGVAMIALGGWFTYDGWVKLLDEGYYYPKSAALFPLFAMGGLGMLLFPVDYDQLEAEHGVAKVELWRHMPSIWKAWSALCVVAALGNWYAMAHFGE